MARAQVAASSTERTFQAPGFNVAEAPLLEWSEQRVEGVGNEHGAHELL